MNWDKLEKKLIAAARNNPPGDGVPYAFETRVMARLISAPRPNDWVWWGRGLWLGAGACAAIALMTSVWSVAPDNETDSAASFSQGVEQSLFASADDSESAW